MNNNLNNSSRTLKRIKNTHYRISKKTTPISRRKYTRSMINIPYYDGQLFKNNLDIAKIKISNMFSFEELSFDVEKEDATTVNILVEKYSSFDPQVIEFYDSNNELCAKAKGFDSVL